MVALGGGHGLSATLKALTGIVEQPIGIVGTIDDGGSSGRLRRHLDIPPPGDLRMAMAALMPDDPEGVQWRAVLQHRFDGEVDVGGHALGNLVLAALWEETGDVVAGLDILGQAMRAQGRVLPHALAPAELVAEITDGDSTRVVRGQAAVSQTRGDVVSMRIEPAQPQACEQALEAIRRSDVLIFGPGSWFTSVLPHLLIEDVREAVRASSAHRILIVNLSGESGEAEGYPAHGYLTSWARFFPDIGLDTVLADGNHVDDVELLATAASRVGAAVDVRDLARDGVHDPRLLAMALSDLLSSDASMTDEGRGVIETEDPTVRAGTWR